MVELYTSTSAPNEPKSYEDAKASTDASKWISAMKEEIDTLEKRSTWGVVKRPKDKPVVSCKWVYHMKLNEAGEIVCYKARLVARGFSQTYGVDYKDTFAPVTRLETLRLMFALAVEQNWEIHQIDVKNAYLYGDLDDTGGEGTWKQVGTCQEHCKDWNTLFDMFPACQGRPQRSL